MRLSDIQSACLNSVCDDYEDFASIKNDVGRQIGRAVADNELCQALRDLVSAALVVPYVYDRVQTCYVRVTDVPEQWDSGWFLISDRGRNTLRGDGHPCG